jgi:hypothetical protein
MRVRSEFRPALRLVQASGRTRVAQECGLDETGLWHPFRIAHFSHLAQADCSEECSTTL